MASEQTDGAPADAAVPDAAVPSDASDLATEEAMFEAIISGTEDQAESKPVAQQPAEDLAEQTATTDTTTDDTTTAPSGGQAEEAAPEPENGEGDDDPWAAAPQVLRDQFDRSEKARENLEANLTRERGQISALHKKLDALTKQSGQPGGGKDFAAKMAALEQKVTETAEEYGDVNGPLAEYTRAQRQMFEGAISEVRGQMESLQASIERREVERLESEFPGYQKFVDDHREAFFSWVNHQDPRVVAVVQASDSTVPDGYALAKVLNRFKAETMGDAAQSASADPPPADADAPDPLTARRQEQRQSAQTPRSTTPAVPPAQNAGVIEDEEAYFAKVVADMEKARAG